MVKKRNTRCGLTASTYTPTGDEDVTPHIKMTASDPTVYPADDEVAKAV